MPKPQNSRKARFRAALALAEMSAAEWAEENGVTPAHLSQVLAAKRDSKSLVDKIDEFTRTHLKGLVAA